MSEVKLYSITSLAQTMAQGADNGETRSTQPPMLGKDRDPRAEGVRLWQAGRDSEALPWLVEATFVAENGDLQQWLRDCVVPLGRCMMNLGLGDRAERLRGRAAARLSEAGPRDDLSHFRLFEADLALLGGLAGPAQEALESLERELRLHPSRQLMAALSIRRAQLALSRGDLSAANAHLGTARRSLRGLAIPIVECEFSMVSAQAALAEEKVSEGARHLRKAIEIAASAGLGGLHHRALAAAGLIAAERAQTDVGCAAFPLPLTAEVYWQRALQARGRAGALDAVEVALCQLGLGGADQQAQSDSEPIVAVEAAARAIARSNHVLLGELAEWLPTVGPQHPLSNRGEGGSHPVWELAVQHHRQTGMLLGELDASLRTVVDALADGWRLRSRIEAFSSELRALVGVDRAQLLDLCVHSATRLFGARSVVVWTGAQNGELDTIASLGGESRNPSPEILDAIRLCAREGRAKTLAGTNESSTSTQPEACCAMLAPIRHDGASWEVLVVEGIEAPGADFGVFDAFTQAIAAIRSPADPAPEDHDAEEPDVAIVEVLREPVVIVEPAGTIRAMSKSAALLLHAEPNDLRGKSLGSIPGCEPLFEAVVSARDVDGIAVVMAGRACAAAVRCLFTKRSDRMKAAVISLDPARPQRGDELVQTTRSARFSFDDVVAVSDRMREQVSRARAAASNDMTVLIIGESGTGKEVIAQSIHRASDRANGPYVGINCAAIPGELLESELFGYVEGAFTGARRRGNPGKLELASHGTLLLDEIGDMPLIMQAKLLRVLEERRFQPLGSRVERRLTARVLATTNSDLDGMVAEGRFRADLLYRMDKLRVSLPPLRDRAQDIEALAHAFLQKNAKRHGRAMRAMSQPVLDAFQAYPWPGNVRELANVIEAAVCLADPSEIVLTTVPEAVLRPSEQAPVSMVRPVCSEASESFETAERDVLVAILTRCDGSIRAAARALGVSRGKLYHKIRKYGVDVESLRRKAGQP